MIVYHFRQNTLFRSYSFLLGLYRATYKRVGGWGATAHHIGGQHLPEWKVDRDGTFLGNATGCLEELTAGVRLLRFTMLQWGCEVGR